MDTTNRKNEIVRALRKRARRDQATAARYVDEAPQFAQRLQASARAYFDAALTVEKSSLA